MQRHFSAVDIEHYTDDTLAHHLHLTGKSMKINQAQQASPNASGQESGSPDKLSDWTKTLTEALGNNKPGISPAAGYIWIEGGDRAGGHPFSPQAEACLHRSVGAGDPKGPHKEYSFGLDSGISGRVYEDVKTNGPILRIKKTTPEQEKQFIQEMDAAVKSGEPRLYAIQETCRSWSFRTFENAPGVEIPSQATWRDYIPDNPLELPASTVVPIAEPTTTTGTPEEAKQ